MKPKEELKDLVVDPRQLIAGIHVQFKPTHKETMTYDDGLVKRVYYAMIDGKRYDCRVEEGSDPDWYYTSADMYYNVNGVGTFDPYHLLDPDDDIVLSMIKNTYSSGSVEISSYQHKVPGKPDVFYKNGMLLNEVPDLTTYYGDRLLSLVRFMCNTVILDKNFLNSKDIAIVDLINLYLDEDYNDKRNVYLNEDGKFCCEIYNDNGTVALKAIQNKSKFRIDATNAIIDRVDVIMHGIYAASLMIMSKAYNDSDYHDFTLYFEINRKVCIDSKIKEFYNGVLDIEVTEHYIPENNVARIYFDENGNHTYTREGVPTVSAGYTCTVESLI